MNRRGEIFSIVLAVLFYAAVLLAAVARTGWDSIRWGQYPVFLPTGLLVMSGVNVRLRSKILGWGVFTLGFVLLVVILGAFVVQIRLEPNVPWFVFGRALGMYGSLVMAGLFQLRGARSAGQRRPPPTAFTENSSDA